LVKNFFKSIGDDDRGGDNATHSSRSSAISTEMSATGGAEGPQIDASRYGPMVPYHGEFRGAEKIYRELPGDGIQRELVGWMVPTIESGGDLIDIYSADGELLEAGSPRGVISEDHLYLDILLLMQSVRVGGGRSLGTTTERVPAVRRHPVNISTTDKPADVAESIREYARRSNKWLQEAGPQKIVPTKGPLRKAANDRARAERLRAKRAGRPYRKGYHAGHVPDTAVSGMAEPPGGWLEMPGPANSACGGVLGCRIGEFIDHFTVDGRIP
jgi:hypothetical protein